MARARRHDVASFEDFEVLNWNVAKPPTMCTVKYDLYDGPLEKKFFEVERTSRKGENLNVQLDWINHL